jgi:D-3-phosphoglycerate dehydrogenase
MAHSLLKVVITDCDHVSIEEESEEFGRLGAELILAQVQEEKDLIQACKEADGLVNQYALLTRKVFENLPKCQVVSRYGVGVDCADDCGAVFGVAATGVSRRGHFQANLTTMTSAAGLPALSLPGSIQDL